MNRRDMIQAIVACEAIARAFRDALAADALTEWEQQGTAPTWRPPGVTVSCSVTHATVHIYDEPRFLEWVRARHPDQVETLERVRPAWQTRFLAAVAERGDPPHDADGEVIPGLQYMPGGSFRALSIRPSTDLQDRLRQTAREMAAGTRPLVLSISTEEANQ